MGGANTRTDFSSGVFKFKRTASGRLPTDRDLLRSLTVGVRGTGMVPQLHLSERERLEMVKYVKTLSPAFQRQEQPLRPLELPRRPSSKAALVKVGMQWYFKAGCDKCHGKEGKGNEEIIATLRDSAGRPVPVPDLSLVPYKQGEDIEDIAWVVWTGRDGTPMPSYQDALTPEQLWGVAAYVQTLQAGRKPARMMGLIGEEVRAMRIDMEAVRAWRMGRMPMGRGMGRRRRR